MFTLLQTSIFEIVINFLTNTIGAYISFDYLLYIVLGIFVIMLFIIFIKSNSSYEVKACKAIDKMNTYLVANPYINEDNLVIFNKKMKSVPKTIRYQWQQYVLNRDKAPSNYLSRDNCVEKPLKSSSYQSSIKLLKNVTVILSALAFVLGLLINTFAMQIPSGTTGYSAYIYTIAMTLFRASIIPAIMIIISELYTIFLRSRGNSLTASLYQIFYDFERNMDKASTTLPDYIDYEVLFTKHEIKSGIPILQEYLDKRDRQQQEELKRAMAREIEHEKYNFDTTGIDGSLLLERAMKESELFIVNRKRLIAEIEQLQTEQENNKKNFDMATKEVNRKLQATKENLIKFKAQQEQSTNRIETNYIRKQQAEEVRKQQQLERDLEESIKKFDEAQASIEREIESRNAEIEENRKYIEEAMIAEFDTFSEKAYKLIYDSVESKLDEQIQAIKDSTEEQRLKVESLENQVQDKHLLEEELASTKEQLDNLQKEHNHTQMLYDELLMKFTAMNGGSIRLQSLVGDDLVDTQQLNKAKQEILEAIKNVVVNVPVVAKPEQEKTVTKEKAKPAVKKVIKSTIPKRKAKKVSDEDAEEKQEKKTSESKKGTTKSSKPTTKSTKSTAKSSKSSKSKTANVSGQSSKATTKKSSQDEEAKRKRAEARKKKREEEAKRKADALLELQRRIEEENAKLSKQQDELKKVIDSTIEVIGQTEEKPKTRKKSAEKVVEEVKEEQPVEQKPEDEQKSEPIQQEASELVQTEESQPVVENEADENNFNTLQELANKMNSDNK